jgi:hypothetical protein
LARKNPRKSVESLALRSSAEQSTYWMWQSERLQTFVLKKCEVIENTIAFFSQ